jgi:hypothetical protein
MQNIVRYGQLRYGQLLGRPATFGAAPEYPPPRQYSPPPGYTGYTPY